VKRSITKQDTNSTHLFLAVLLIEFRHKSTHCSDSGVGDKPPEPLYCLMMLH